MVDGFELVDAVVELVTEQQQRKMYFMFALVSLITTIISIAVICSLSFFVAIRLKDTGVSHTAHTMVE